MSALSGEDDVEWAIAAQADAMDALFCPVRVTRANIGVVYCDCQRGHVGSHTGIMPGGGWMTWPEPDEGSDAVGE